MEATAGSRETLYDSDGGWYSQMTRLLVHATTFTTAVFAYSVETRFHSAQQAKYSSVNVSEYQSRQSAGEYHRVASIQQPPSYDSRGPNLHGGIKRDQDIAACYTIGQRCGDVPSSRLVPLPPGSYGRRPMHMDDTIRQVWI